MNHNKILICDTNVIIRYLLQDHDELSKKSSKIFDQILSGKYQAIISETVITECVYVLEKIYNVTKEEISKTLIDLIYYKGVINNDKEVIIDALKLYENNNLHIVDCILSAKTNHLDAELFSFDQQLLKLTTR